MVTAALLLAIPVVPVSERGVSVVETAVPASLQQCLLTDSIILWLLPLGLYLVVFALRSSQDCLLLSGIR